MKTIFDKVDTKYLEHTAHGIECSTGVCDHTIHKSNGLLWVMVFSLVLITIKTWKTRLQ